MNILLDLLCMCCAQLGEYLKMGYEALHTPNMNMDSSFTNDHYTKRADTTVDFHYHPLGHNNNEKEGSDDEENPKTLLTPSSKTTATYGYGYGEAAPTTTKNMKTTTTNTPTNTMAFTTTDSLRWTDHLPEMTKTISYLHQFLAEGRCIEGWDKGRVNAVSCTILHPKYFMAHIDLLLRASMLLFLIKLHSI